MALVTKKASELALGDQVFILRTITQLTLTADKVAVSYDDGNTVTYGPDDGLQVGDPLAADPPAG